ncbi:MAG: helix-turn-helix domain-containing protein [Clostridia bacterium]|nr:helix-turn-helix domain-containing protein [Clostridia bacterium]
MKKYITKKEKGFVQISNSILSDPNISLKAKTVLAIMLSLPDNWDFSIEGIAGKCKESKDCIAKAINELIDAGYVKRTKTRGEDGRIIKWDYEVFEEPYKTNEQSDKESCEEKPDTALSYQEKPSQDTSDKEYPEEVNPEQVFPELDNPTEEIPDEETKGTYNTIINKKENNNILFSNTQSNPIQSKHKISFNMSEIELKECMVKDNIEYDILLQKFPGKRAMIDEIVELMVEVLCSKRETMTIASDTHPIEQVKERFKSIDDGHIEYILECLDKNTTEIHNIKQYLLSVIYNAPQTMDNYYTVAVNYDLCGQLK